MSNMKVDPMKIDDYYFPVSHGQVKNLVGQMLTHLEAMNLSEKAEQANKSIINQTIYRWWEFAQENSLTSWQGCIGPIYANKSREGTSTIGSATEYTWFTDVGQIKPTAKSDLGYFEKSTGYADSKSSLK